MIFNGGIYGYIGYILSDKYGAFIIWHYDYRKIKVITNSDSSKYQYTTDGINWGYF